MTKEVFFQKHSRLTRSLKKFVLDYETSLEPAVFAAFLESLAETLDAAREELLLVPAGADRARRLQERVDEEIAREAEIPVSCQKGCSACCHMEVEITSDEAEILKPKLAMLSATEKDRLQQQGRRSLRDPLWREGRTAANRCVFLDPSSGSCGIYEDRPVMCRRHSVTSPAVHCESPELSVVLRYFPRVDLWISAANEIPGVRRAPLAQFLTHPEQKP